MLKEVRCKSCNRLLLKSAGHVWLQVKCPRCKTVNDWKVSEEKKAG